jgi:hypothetical protein
MSTLKDLLAYQQCMHNCCTSRYSLIRYSLYQQQQMQLLSSLEVQIVKNKAPLPNIIANNLSYDRVLFLSEALL